jgi:hypothetical protein
VTEPMIPIRLVRDLLRACEQATRELTASGQDAAAEALATAVVHMTEGIMVYVGGLTLPPPAGTDPDAN